MNKIKFTNYNTSGQPQNIILKYANGDVEVLDKCKSNLYYDKVDKKYVSFKKFYKINNEIYV